jgi:hypothetical protein
VNAGRPWIWLIALVLGAADAALVGVGGPLGLVLLGAALPLAWRGKAIGLAGLLIGFGGAWLLLMANQSASGGQLADPGGWLALGAVRLAIGLVVAVVGVLGPRQRGPG